MNSTTREVTTKLDYWNFFLFNLNLHFYSQLIFLLPLPMYFSFTFGPCKGSSLSFGDISLLAERQSRILASFEVRYGQLP